jgi:hypothetical protein
MTAEEWTTFVAGYRRERSPAAFHTHFRFWAAVALVDAALFRYKARTEGVEIPMARLAALVRTRKAGPGMGAA